MDEQKYTDSDEYQKEIAEQYKQRVAKFPKSQVVAALNQIGIQVDPESVEEAVVGNMNATYLTPEVAIKINQDRSEVDYFANKLISDKLSSEYPVVKVIAYDNFEKTGYELLVMERSTGTLLLNDIFDLSPKTQEDLFREILNVVKAMTQIKFNDFGNINSSHSFPTYTEYLRHTFTENITQIREQRLCEESDIARVEKYFLEHVQVFDNESPVFVHADLHMGNVLHSQKKLTAIIDFDHSLKAPAIRALVPLLGIIDNPSQFVEGTPDFPGYKGKSFYNLLPVLQTELSEILSEPLLLQKLNILYIRDAIDVIAGNWSAGLNKMIMQNIVSLELDENNLEESYYGKILQH
jgi:hypothetical protein